MLQFIRSKAGSLLVKLLFVALIACFVLWGVGDFMRDSGGGTDAIVKVGSSGKIMAPELTTEIQRQTDNAKRMFGTSLNHDQLKQLGVVDRAVDGLVSRALFDQEALRLHLVAGDDEIFRTIQQDPSLRDKDGKFSKDILASLLQQNHLTDVQYYDLMRSSIPRLDLGQIALGNANAPDVLVNLLFAHRAEQRVADYVFLPITTIGDVGTPDAAAMDAYYKAHAQAFTAPEYRSFTVLALTDSAVSASITIPDATLRDLYQQHQDEYSLPEQRDVENIVLPDEATTKKATDALAKGEDFYAVAKRLANEDKDALDLGWVSRKDLPTEMGNFVFAAKQGATSQGIHTDFGWSILRVKDIRPPHIVPYEEAKPKLDAEARHDAAANALYTLSNKVEDAVAGGADMKAIAQQFNLKPFSVDMIDQNGIRPSGVAVTGLPVATADLAKTAFATQAGQSSDLTQTNDGKFFMLHVDKVSPPTPRPFAEVKDQVKAAWIKDRQNEKLDSMTADLVKTVKGGTKLADLAKARHLTLATSKPFGHDGDFSGGLPANMTATLFSVPLGTVTSARGLQDNVDGAYIGVLTKIMPADAKANAVGAQQVKQQLNADIGGELITEFSQALRRDYPVLVNQTALDRLY